MIWEVLTRPAYELCTMYSVAEIFYHKLTNMFCISVVGKPYFKELLLAPISQGRLQVVRSLIRISQSQANIWCWDFGPAESCTIVWLQSSSICRPQYPLIWCDLTIESKGKGKGTRYNSAYTSTLVTSSALQSRKWQLAWANDTTAHYAAIHCSRSRTIGPTVQHTDIPPPQSAH